MTPAWSTQDWTWWFAPPHMIMPLVPVLLVGLIVAGALLLERKVSRPDDNGQLSGSRAVEVLDEQYAKGEINREEYQQRRRDILVR